MLKNLTLLTACLLLVAACKEAKTDAPAKDKKTAEKPATEVAEALPDSVGNYSPELLATMKQTCVDNALKRSQLDKEQVGRLCDCVVNEMARRCPNKDDLPKLMADKKLSMEIALECANI